MFQRSLLSIYLLSLLSFFIVFVLLCFIYLFIFYFLGGGVGFVVELNKFRANKCKQSKGKESDPTSSLSKVL